MRRRSFVVALIIFFAATMIPVRIESAIVSVQAQSTWDGTNMGWQALYPNGLRQTFSDRMTMVMVPQGCFLMGSESGYEDEQPVREECFDSPFWIDETEVTQVNFQRLSGYQADAPDYTGDERPVEDIAFLEAAAFCESRGARLPTEGEWEYAARGPDAWMYPWGNDWDGSRVVWDRTGGQGTANVKSLPEGRSWVGAYDMIGNVWEWVNTLYRPEDNFRIDRRFIIRGGAWYVSVPKLLRASTRYGYYAETASKFGVGFRCVREHGG